ncbi:MAG: hypothetical protein GQ564_19580 [Bacteroidales bacterium]|nr:hypothetical protein [Bacteroidales bacterium]
MSVTIDGIKGYEYQYKVTVLIALVTKADKINLFVEKEGSEDALLIIEKNGVTFNIEIQVKREKNLIGIPKIVNWLCHFQERKTDNNLLQKLIDTKQSIALFVTHSRCSDSILNLKTDFLSFEKHNSLSFSKTFFIEFKEALKSLKLGSTDIMNQREEFCRIQAENFKTKTELDKVLEQCLIFEEFTDEKVDNYINLTLNANYSIAQSRADVVYLQLLEIVKKGRDTGEEISEELYNHIQSNKIGSPIIDSHYKTRIEESYLIEELGKNGALLLTGISQCGKTELAKTTASHFVNKGYDYQINDDISDLKRFLNSNISDNKIAILEDPFGYISLKENYFEILHKLKDLLGNKEKHHFIIVSSKVELLSEIFDSNNISDYKIKGYPWQELTIKKNDEIISFWELLAISKSLPKEIISVVSKGILDTKSENILQIGQLMYLVNEEIDQLINKDFNELEHIARRNSVEIANDIKSKNEYAASVLSLISICSSPIHKLEFKDLTYITSSTTTLFSITEKEVFTSSFANDKTPIFPEYPDDLVIEEDVVDAINYLEERGLITITAESLLITHPNYYEAGRYLFFERASVKQKSKLEQYKKCIACLNPFTSFLATRNYSFIYNKIKTEYTNEVINIAFIGLDSIFPSVEDTSLIFLTNFIKELEEEQYHQLVGKIQSGGTSSYNIYWYNDIPFISNEGGFSNLFVDYDELIIKRVEDLISKGIKPNIHDAWIYIESLKKKKKVSKDDICLLLQFNEGFIRQKVVYQIFAHPYIVDNELINELFNDEHPSVVFSTIRASLLNWFSLTDAHKALVKELSIQSFTKKHITIRAFSLISTFSIDYSHESVFSRDFDEAQKKEMWQLWGKLFPACVENVPLGVHINSARFGATMDDAIKYLDVETGLDVLESWFERIDYQIQNDKILDEYEMAIADNLMELTSTNFKVRKKLFSKLVNYKDTSFILSNLKWIIEYWNKLDNSEKNAIIALVNSGRLDVRWIKAVLLNSYSPPKEIINAIFGDKDLFEKDTEKILEVFPESLLRDCLNVYCGFPQPLWWLAVHHKNDKFWLKLIEHILLDENNIAFDICLEEFISDGVNSFSLFRKNGMELWSEICSNVQNKKVLAESLINNMARCSSCIAPVSKMWSVLIKSYSNTQDLLLIIKDNIEMLLFCCKDDFIRVMDYDFMKEQVIPMVDSLKLLKQKVQEIGEAKKQEVEHTFQYKLDNWIGIN